MNLEFSFTHPSAKLLSSFDVLKGLLRANIWLDFHHERTDGNAKGSSKNVENRPDRNKVWIVWNEHQNDGDSNRLDARAPYKRI